MCVKNSVKRKTTENIYTKMWTKDVFCVVIFGLHFEKVASKILSSIN